MGLKNRLARIAFCGILAAAAAGGVYMRPEEIDELMDTMNRPRVAHVLPEERENGDDLIRRLLADAEG